MFSRASHGGGQPPVRFPGTSYWALFGPDTVGTVHRACRCLPHPALGTELPNPGPPTWASAGLPSWHRHLTMPTLVVSENRAFAQLWPSPLCATWLSSSGSVLVAYAHRRLSAVSSLHCLWTSRLCPVMDLTASQVGKLRHREVRELTQGHKTDTQGQDSTLVLTQV